MAEHRWRRWAGVVTEAMAGLSQNPGRTILTMLGTVLGLGAFVSVLGLTSTAAGQISGEFTALQATLVTVNDAAEADDSPTVFSFPDDAEDRALRLNGVQSAGVAWAAPGSHKASASSDPRSDRIDQQVMIASRGYLDTLKPTWADGSGFTQFETDENLPVAVIGATAARRLGISEAGGVLFIDDVPYQVTGVIADVARQPESLVDIFVPYAYGKSAFGLPVTYSPAKMLVQTQVGAANQVAGELTMALRPDNPAVLAVVPPADPPRLGSVISGSMQNLFLALTGITLLVGVASIANTTLVSVLERTSEIGLRRALGATKGQVIAQFLIESATLGAIAGMVGAAVGVFVVLGASLAMGWTALLEPWVVFTAPAIGAVVGLAAGAYPAWKAGRIDPIAALRR
jgi:putative ABC transport system permease protein